MLNVEKEETVQLLGDLSLHLERVKLSFFSGRLVVSTPDRERSWVFNFHLGRLNWSGGTNYGMAWWRRHLGVASNRIASRNIQVLANSQQPELVSVTLNDLLVSQQLDRKYLCDLTAQMFEEAIFDIVQCAYNLDRTLNYEYFYNVQREASTTQALPLLSTQPSLERAWKKWQDWKQAGLAALPVSLPIDLLAEKNSLTSLTDKQKKFLPLLMRGYTLRDVACATRQHLQGVALELQPLFHTNVIDVKSGIDVLAMIESLGQIHLGESVQSSFFPTFIDTSTDLAIEYQPLVACIDDSEIVHYRLGQIFTQHGYRLTSVQNPLFTIPSLLKNKPDLIFLDLVMPNMNGYEVCNQIRKTPLLKQIPVIILTGKDGVVDKMRSKLVGSSDFLSKPIDPEAVLRMLFYYLPLKS
jgi:two-component system, chemotaxis family, response regulator PixG